jgi:hypothetical protein
MTLPPRNNSPEGTSYVIKLKEPDNELKQDVEGFQAAVFPLFGSILILNARPILDGFLEAHKKKLSSYNAKLAKNKIPIRIRLTHTTVSKGHRYSYCGRFIFRKNGKYVGKLDNTVLRNEYIRDLWNKVGPPPVNPIEGFSFRIVTDESGMETNNIIVPYGKYVDNKYNHLFTNLIKYRLG